jgi:hypothetical protein
VQHRRLKGYRGGKTVTKSDTDQQQPMRPAGAQRVASAAVPRTQFTGAFTSRLARQSCNPANQCGLDFSVGDRSSVRSVYLFVVASSGTRQPQLSWSAADHQRDRRTSGLAAQTLQYSLKVCHQRCRPGRACTTGVE